MIFFPSHLIQIFDHHVDGNRPCCVFEDLSSELNCDHTDGLVFLSFTLVKLWGVVIDVDDVDQYICCGAGRVPIDV